jgi:hypothetical protein
MKDKEGNKNSMNPWKGKNHGKCEKEEKCDKNTQKDRNKKGSTYILGGMEISFRGFEL